MNLSTRPEHPRPQERRSRTVAADALSVAVLGTVWIGGFPVSSAGQEVVRFTPSVSCAECRIEITRELVLEGGAEALGGVTHPHFLVQDGRGRYYLNSEFSTSTVQVFDSTGQFMTTFGRPGQGPREFQRVTSAVVGPADSLYLFDVQARTYTVVDPDYEVVRRGRLGAQVRDALILESGHLVVNADIRGAERFGYPLHLVEGDSLGPTIGPADPIEGRTRPEPSRVLRALAVDGGDRFYSAWRSSYVIDHWTVSGDRVRQLVGEPPWWEKEEDRTRPRASGNPVIRALSTDGSGRLWLLATVRSERFDALALVRGYHPVATGPDRPIVESRTGDLEDLRVRIIEVIDPERGEVLATARHSAVFRGFLDGRRIWSYEEDAGGGRIVIWRVALVAG